MDIYILMACIPIVWAISVEVVSWRTTTSLAKHEQDWFNAATAQQKLDYLTELQSKLHKEGYKFVNRTLAMMARLRREVEGEQQRQQQQRMGIDVGGGDAAMTELDTLKGAARQVDDELAKVLDPSIEAKQKAAAEMAWGSGAAATAGAEAAAAPAPEAPAAAPVVAAAAAAPLKDLASWSVEELEAEIARRRK